MQCCDVVQGVPASGCHTPGACSGVSARTCQNLAFARYHPEDPCKHSQHSGLCRKCSYASIAVLRVRPPPKMAGLHITKLDWTKTVPLETSSFAVPHFEVLPRCGRFRPRRLYTCKSGSAMANVACVVGLCANSKSEDDEVDSGQILVDGVSDSLRIRGAVSSGRFR